MSAIESKAQLSLNLRSEGEPEFQGWWVAAGSNAPSVGVGVVLILSPEIAQKTADNKLTREEKMQLAAATLGCFERAMLQSMGVDPEGLFDPERN